MNLKTYTISYADELEISSSQHLTIFKSSPVGVVCIDAEGYVETANFAGTRVLDAPVSVLKHTSFSTYLSEIDREYFTDYLNSVQQSGAVVELDVTICSHQSRPKKVQLVGSSFKIDESTDRKVQLAMIDTSRQQDAEEQLRNAKDYLERLAHHDPLTNLPNRMLFNDTLRSALVKARKFKNKLAVLFIDIDGFKPVNDLHGHVTGDLLLCEIANRLRAHTRDKHTVARIGGRSLCICEHRYMPLS